MVPTRSKIWVMCGRVGRPWGVRGGIFVDWFSGSCPVKVGNGRVYVRNEDAQYEPLCVAKSKEHGKRHIVMLEGVTSRDEALKLRGATFFLPEDELETLPEGEYYSYQILGMTVTTEVGEEIGEVVKIFSAGDNDVYVVRSGDGHEILIPAIDHVVKKIDMDAKKITIDPIEGLLD